MRFLLAALLLILLSATCQAEFLREHGTHITFGHSPLQKRIVSEAAKTLLDTETPERLKRWAIFQDGNRFREAIRSGYIKLLRRVDKIREPYAFSKGVKKQWIYEPDLRKHYFVPRVLRVPAILQDSPIQHDEAFAAFIKGTNQDFGLQDVVVTHVPELSKFKEAETGKESSLSATKSESQEPLTEQNPPGESMRRRRRTRGYHRRQSFNQFRSATNDAASTEKSPAAEIESEGSLAHQQAGPTQNPEQPAAERVSNAERLSNTLVEMEERFNAMKKFKETQMHKSAMRYVGHPQYRAPVEQESDPAVTAGAPPGLKSIRIRPAVDSQDVTPETTPRQPVDLAGTDADASNPITPHNNWDGTFLYTRFKTPFSDTPRAPSPLPDPSPLVSTGGGMTPRTGDNTGATSPNPFRLPVDYDELLHSARLQRGQNSLHTSHSKPSLPLSSVADSKSNYGTTFGSSDGTASRESAHKLQETSRLNRVDYTVYDHASLDGRRQFASTLFDRLHPYSDEEPVSDALSPSVKRKVVAKEAASFVRSARRPFRSPTNRQFARQTPAKEATHSYSSQPQPVDVEMQDASMSVIQTKASQPDETLLTGATGSKRFKRPPALDKAFVRSQSFLFPTDTRVDPASPFLEGFKPSVKADADSSAELSPMLPQLSPNQLQRLHERLKDMPSTGSSDAVIQAFRSHRIPKSLHSDRFDVRSTFSTS